MAIETEAREQTLANSEVTPGTFADNLLHLAEQLEMPGPPESAPAPQAVPPKPQAAPETQLEPEPAADLARDEAPDAYAPPELDAIACRRTFPVLNPQCTREYLEQFRALRTRLCLEQRNWSLRQHDLRVVAVLSPSAGDGRSFVAANLAASLAVSDAQVLLVDVNTAAPSLHNRLDVPSVPGLTEALQGPRGLANQAWWTTLRRVPECNLFTMTLGAGGATAIDTVDLQKLPALIEHWRHCFDWVILDGPAFEVTSDAEILSEIADASVLVIRPGKTLFSEAQRSVSRMPAGRVLGIVMNPRPA